MPARTMDDRPCGTRTMEATTPISINRSVRDLDHEAREVDEICGHLFEMLNVMEKKSVDSASSL